MRHHNEDFVKFHEKVSVRTLCAAKFNHFRKDKKMKSAKMLAILLVALGMVCSRAEISEAVPMGTAWTYQGVLMDDNGPADGLYDLQFKLYNLQSGDVLLGPTIDINDLDVIDGHFAVVLDFGSGIGGQIAQVRCARVSHGTG